jgi:hypothetical protein
MPTINDIEIGQVIRFTTIAPNDNNLYKGKVVAECSSTIATFYNDITGYNEQVKAAVPSTPDVELLHFIILDLHEAISEETITTVSIAKEWIDEANLNIIASQSKLNITVYDADETNAAAILGVLRGAGYNAAISQ